mmetsp:Transcript_34092/g.45071  ORF Transcript_34092/g.45071 Transcript_34092/m.45071 type:complete len:110 (+) Transcript_34092:855-1184(+)
MGCLPALLDGDGEGWSFLLLDLDRAKEGEDAKWCIEGEEPRPSESAGAGRSLGCLGCFGWSVKRESNSANNLFFLSSMVIYSIAVRGNDENTHLMLTKFRKKKNQDIKN